MRDVRCQLRYSTWETRGNLALVASYVIKSNSDVPVGIEKTDRYTAISLEYGF
jgi:putative salt-induced outer membrane protein YdiY